MSTTDAAARVQAIRKVLGVMDGSEFTANEFPTLADSQAATAALDTLVAELDRVTRERILLTHFDWTPKPGEELGDLLALLNRGDWSVPWVRGAISHIHERMVAAEAELAAVREREQQLRDALTKIAAIKPDFPTYFEANYKRLTRARAIAADALGDGEQR